MDSIFDRESSTLWGIHILVLTNFYLSLHKIIYLQLI
jgi:hypothetical protein